MTQVVARAFAPDEWECFRDFRLFALQATPAVYGTRYEDAVQRTEEAWRATVSGPFNQSFGLFDGDTLIGITSVFRWDEDPSGETATLASSFILEAYRGQKLSRLLYEVRLAWIRQQKHFKRVVVGHRLSNEASRRANQHFGFVQFRRAPHTWPDGTIEDEIYYEMTLDEVGKL